MNIARILIDACQHFKNKPLIRYRGSDVSYADVVDWTDRLTGALTAHGISEGDRILLLARNKPEWLVTLFAGLRVGGLVVPVNPALTVNEVSYIVEHSKPKIVVVDRDLVGVLPRDGRSFKILDITEDDSGRWNEAVANGEPSRHVKDCRGDAPALMFYTSGTTGRPKGAILSHGAEIFTAELVAKQFRIVPSDVSLIAGSFSFIYPLVIDCLSSIGAGATVVLQERFHPELALKGMESEGATIFMGVPTMLVMMLDWAQGKSIDVSRLRLCVSAGQNLSWSVAKRFRERFGVSVYDLWGQTEGTPITSYDPASEPEGRPESCGRALPGCAVRIVDDEGNDLAAEEVGEVLLTGPNIMLGYHDDPNATANTLREGWIYTGDLGKLDADGYLYIVGRKRDLIIRGGANIYPVEVEEAVYSHPAVGECTVVGVADETYGELVKVFVVSKVGETLSKEQLIQHCRRQLAEYKVPTYVEFLDELPKGPTGKILKRVLRVRASAG